MRKSDLKNGYVVRLGNSVYGFVMHYFNCEGAEYYGDGKTCRHEIVFIDHTGIGHESLSNYREDLTHKCPNSGIAEEFKITEVWRAKTFNALCKCAPLPNDENGGEYWTLLWVRDGMEEE